MADLDFEDDNDQGGWDDWKDDGSEPAVLAKSLFGDDEFPTSEEAFDHMKSNHGFDVLALQKSFGLDQYGCIRLVNYVRTLTKENPEKMKSMTDFSCTTEDFSDEKFFVPVMEDDVLLMHEYDQDGFDDEDSNNTNDNNNNSGQPTIDSLKEELRKIKAAFAIYREATEKEVLGGLTAAELRSDGDAFAKKQSAAKADQIKNSNDADEEADADMDSYFNSYSHFGIHEEMLKDKIRTESYRDSMYKNKSLFEGKIVLDVGCGTGILSMMAARAGAKQVIAIDNSGIIATTREIIKANGLDDKITLIRGKVEETVLPVAKVDIIISEWMGYFLFFESMLDTVLYARDKWLAPDGVVLPDRCSLHIVGIADVARYEDRIGYWSDVYGFKMDVIRPKIFFEPDIVVVDPETVVTNPVLLKDCNIMTTNVKELAFDTKWALTVDKDATITALCVYFDTFFGVKCDNPITFSTGPLATPTHWRQCMFYLEHVNKVTAGTVIEGSMVAKPNEIHHRQWDVVLTYVVDGTSHTQQHKI